MYYTCIFGACATAAGGWAVCTGGPPPPPSPVSTASSSCAIDRALRLSFGAAPAAHGDPAIRPTGGVSPPIKYIYTLFGLHAKRARRGVVAVLLLLLYIVISSSAST